jgi:ACR3 family arsenite efflux pump ArsB
VLFGGIYILSKTIEPNFKHLIELLRVLGDEILFKSKAPKAGTINFLMIICSVIIIFIISSESVLDQIGLSIDNNIFYKVISYLFFLIICILSAYFIYRYEKDITGFKD